ncbi:GNAT family acetyltransferase [Clostridium sp. MCC353]|uniref:GNAT family acetyltransferase n=1 Tax=Clostridium sp. MCC353 TaxID=2592646 RepID=UPI001C039B9A|nr:GNAT family acetyltransferase [Clostridium sp. MCC353]MBT9776214.1 GNAT family acetyltransferase [Clostridium sp. MCC353]
MINRSDLVPINYYKKEPFYGSYKGMRYRVIKSDDVLLATVWPEPYNFESTADEKKKSSEFEFTQNGVDQAYQWLDEQYELGNYTCPVY